MISQQHIVVSQVTQDPVLSSAKLRKSVLNGKYCMEPSVLSDVLSLGV